MLHEVLHLSAGKVDLIHMIGCTCIIAMGINQYLHVMYLLDNANMLGMQATPTSIHQAAKGHFAGSLIMVGWSVRLSRVGLGKIGHRLLVVVAMLEMPGMHRAHWRQSESCRKNGEKLSILLHLPVCMVLDTL